MILVFATHFRTLPLIWHIFDGGYFDISRWPHLPRSSFPQSASLFMGFRFSLILWLRMPTSSKDIILAYAFSAELFHFLFQKGQWAWFDTCRKQLQGVTFSFYCVRAYRDYEALLIFLLFDARSPFNWYWRGFILLIYHGLAQYARKSENAFIFSKVSISVRTTAIIV